MAKHPRQPRDLNHAVAKVTIEPSFIKAEYPIVAEAPYRVIVYSGPRTGYYTDHFEPWEFACKHCGSPVKHPYSKMMVARAEVIRLFLNRPTIISGPHRCAEHPIEAEKIAKGGKGGTHLRATGFDIAVQSGHEAYKLIKFALTYLGATGFKYYPDESFVHLDWDTREATW